MNRVAMSTLKKFEGAANKIRLIFCSIQDNTPGGLRTAIQNWLPRIRTDLDRFSPAEMEALILHGRNVAIAKLMKQYQIKMEFADFDWDKRKINPDKIIRELRRGQFRRWRIFSFRDWISMLQLGMLVVLILGSLAPIAHLRNALARADQANATASMNAIDANNELRKLQNKLDATLA
jgi:hypothetical protein